MTKELCSVTLDHKHKSELPVGPEALIKPDFKYRSGEVTDAPAVQLLIERAIAARKGDPIPTCVTKPDYIRENEERLSEESTWSRVVFDGDTLAGLAIGTPVTDLNTEKIIPNRQQLVLLMVDPKYWGEGIGGRLLDWVDSELIRRKIKNVELSTGIDNHRSRTLYERKGYSTTGVESTQYGKQVQYEKSLIPSHQLPK